MRKRDIISLIAVLIVIVQTGAVQVFASEPGSFEIQRTGSLIKESKAYQSEVTLEIVPENLEDRILIKEFGIWMSLVPDENSKYTLKFQRDKEYELMFCAETKDGVRGEAKKVSFVIDSGLGQLVEDCAKLPDLRTANDSEVESRREDIMAIQKRYMDLTDKQRELFPPWETERLRVLVRWLSRMRPTVDVLSPDIPEIYLIGEEDPYGMNIFRADVELKVRPVTTYDFAKVCVRDGEKWQSIEAVDGEYRVMLTKPGLHRVDVCIEDAVGNRSPAAQMEFTIAESLYDFLVESDSTDAVEAETALLDYYALHAYYRDMVGDSILDKLENTCYWQMQGLGMQGKSIADGKDARAIGMLKAFPEGKVEFSITGAPSDIRLPNVSKQVLREYEVSFLDAQENQAVPAENIMIRIELPSILRNRKGVSVYDSGGNALPSYIRNEDQGLVLEFTVGKAGKYYFAADS